MLTFKRRGGSTEAEGPAADGTGAKGSVDVAGASTNSAAAGSTGPSSSDESLRRLCMTCVNVASHVQCMSLRALPWVSESLARTPRLWDTNSVEHLDPPPHPPVPDTKHSGADPCFSELAASLSSIQAETLWSCQTAVREATHDHTVCLRSMRHIHTSTGHTSPTFAD